MRRGPAKSITLSRQVPAYRDRRSPRRARCNLRRLQPPRNHAEKAAAGGIMLRNALVPCLCSSPCPLPPSPGPRMARTDAAAAAPEGTAVQAPTVPMAARVETGRTAAGAAKVRMADKTAAKGATVAVARAAKVRTAGNAADKAATVAAAWAAVSPGPKAALREDGSSGEERGRGEVATGRRNPVAVRWAAQSAGPREVWAAPSAAGRVRGVPDRGLPASRAEALRGRPAPPVEPRGVCRMTAAPPARHSGTALGRGSLGSVGGAVGSAAGSVGGAVGGAVGGLGGAIGGGRSVGSQGNTRVRHRRERERSCRELRRRERAWRGCRRRECVGRTCDGGSGRHRHRRECGRIGGSRAIVRSGSIGWNRDVSVIGSHRPGGTGEHGCALGRLGYHRSRTGAQIGHAERTGCAGDGTRRRRCACDRTRDGDGPCAADPRQCALGRLRASSCRAPSTRTSATASETTTAGTGIRGSCGRRTDP